MASAFRADTDKQHSFLGTPWIKSSNSFLGYICSLECARHPSDFYGLMIFNDGKTSHFYNTFTPMDFLICYLPLRSWAANEAQRMGIITLVLYEQGNQGMWRFNLLSGDIQSRTEQDLKLGTWYLTSLPLGQCFITFAPWGSFDIAAWPWEMGYSQPATSTSQERKLTKGRDADSQREELMT